MKRFSLSTRNIYDAASMKKLSKATWGYLALAFGLVIGLMALFTWLVYEVRQGDTLPIDEAILRWFEGLQTTWLDQIVPIATDLGGIVGIAVLALLALGLLLWRHRHRAAAQLSLGLFGAVGLNLILKNIFTRTRPDLWEAIVTETSYSFPSGHATASSALAFSVILIFWQTKYRWPATIIAITYTLFIGATRLYLGVHYPSDIVGGWTMSAIWVGLVAILIGTLRLRRQQ